MDYVCTQAIDLYMRVRVGITPGEKWDMNVYVNRPHRSDHCIQNTIISTSPLQPMIYKCTFIDWSVDELSGGVDLWDNLDRQKSGLLQ